jgi:N-methylhydantoinase A/oxoprolinase/acetone carboxylase beta subunit
MIDAGTGVPIDAPIHARATLPRGAMIEGPAAITESGTTTIIAPGFIARIAHGGEIVIEAIP